MQRWLAIILLIYIATGTLYAVQTPLWQAPDEPAHFNYIRTIGDTGTLPILQQGDYDQDYLEKIKAAKFPPEMSVDRIRYESYQPPLYYLAAAPVYLVAYVGGLPMQVLALRLFSIVLEVIVLILAFVIVRSIFPSDRFLPLAVTGLVATIPMHVAITASISNDVAAELVLALLLLLAVRRIRGRVSERGYVLAGGAMFGAALLTKSTAYPTGAAILLVGELARVLLCRFPPEVRNRFFRESLGRLVLTAGLALLVSSPMFIRNMLVYGIADPLGLGRHDSVVIGQQTTAAVIALNGWSRVSEDFLIVTFRSFWAQFGWMGVLIEHRLYQLLAAFTGIAVIGFVLYVVFIRLKRVTMSREQLWMLVPLAVLPAVAFADYIGYQFKFYQLQGRYLFPALIPLALFLVLGWRTLVPTRFRPFAFLALYMGLVGLDIACLFLYIIPQLRTT